MTTDRLYGEYPSREHMVRAAKELASVLHRGQVDLYGAPYFGHTDRVASMVECTKLTYNGQMDNRDRRAYMEAAAYLHDVVEDKKASLGGIESYGFPPRVLELVRLLTRLPDEPLNVYIDRVKSDTDAIIIKLADVTDNLDITRALEGSGNLWVLGESDFRRHERYAKVARRLWVYLHGEGVSWE